MQSGGPERPSSHAYTTHICDAICDHEKFFVTRSRPRRPISSSAGFCNANNFPNATAAPSTVALIEIAASFSKPSGRLHSGVIITGRACDHASRTTSGCPSLSDGSTIAGPKAHTNLLGKLRRTSRALLRKRKGSQNHRKAQKKLARLHARIANIRKDATHKATTMLAKNCQRIGIEELNVRGMSRNRHLARLVMDGGFYELTRQLEYKAKMYGSLSVVADRWYASSKTCSCCGVVKQTPALSQRTFNCDDCGFEVDRDVNAARNVESVAASSAVTVCGEDRSGAKRKSRVKRASVKQNTATDEAA